MAYRGVITLLAHASHTAGPSSESWWPAMSILVEVEEPRPHKSSINCFDSSFASAPHRTSATFATRGRYTEFGMCTCTEHPINTTCLGRPTYYPAHCTVGRLIEGPPKCCFPHIGFLMRIGKGVLVINMNGGILAAWTVIMN